jgi:hypothetical protein
MASHVILDSIIVDYGRLWLVLLGGVVEGVVKVVRPLRQLFDAEVNGGLNFWIFPKSPIILVPDIRPTDFLVEVIGAICIWKRMSGL